MSKARGLINFVFYKYGEYAYFPDSKELMTRDDEEYEKYKNDEQYIFDIEYVGNVIKFEMEAMGWWWDIIEDYFPKILDRYLNPPETKEVKKASIDDLLNNENATKVTEILTLWEWSYWQDSYTGEYDSDFHMLGFVALFSIKTEDEPIFMGVDPGSPEGDKTVKQDFESLGTLCSVCEQPQFYTPSGPSCINGHGGAPALEE